ncbi:MAG: NADH-quinone oxidoreductase subunit C [Thermodesulfovibrionales bacterium]|nr:NADH-quinone oxidoreductase subunit C [Thermodesulfovibrionales bacterium]
MDSIKITDKLKKILFDDIIEICQFANQYSIVVKKQRIVDIMRFLHDDPELDFNHLQDLCGVDYKDTKDYRFEVVYQLFSIQKCHSIRIRAAVPEDDPTIDTVTTIWEGASWHERECYDMFGIVFKGHPDLRRVLMPEDWEGHPLRKDYPLKGPKEYWRGFQEVLQKSQEYRQYETKEI